MNYINTKYIMDINELKFMSIGGNCADIAYLGNNRIHGPVDNMFARYGLVSSLSLLDKTFENDMLNGEYVKNGPKDYTFNKWNIAHNDYTEKYKIELKRRIGVFNEFYKNIDNPNNYFVYTLNRHDLYRHKFDYTQHPRDCFKQAVLEIQKFGCLNKVIFVGCICEKFFETSFFQYNSDEIYNIVPNYILLKNIEINNKQTMEYNHTSFLREIKKLKILD